MRLMRYLEAVDAAHISYRQADYWRRSGYVHASMDGSGSVSEISDTEAAVLLRMAALVKAGMLAKPAAAIARATVEQQVRAVDLPAGIRIVFDVVQREPVPA